MKRKLIFITTIVLGMAFQTSAQTEKGAMVLGGVAAYSNTLQELATNGNIRTEHFELVPTINYFVINNLSVGMGIGYTHGKIRDSGASTITSSDFLTVSPNVKMYINVSERFKFFGQFDISTAFGMVNSVNKVNRTVNAKFHEQRYGATLSPGLSFFPASYLGLEFSFSGVGYRLINGRDQIGNNNYRITSFDIGLTAFTPRVSVNYYF